MTTARHAAASILLLVAGAGLPVALWAQSQPDLDQIASDCKAKPGKLTLVGDRIVLHADPNDSFEVMGCIRARLEKIPGAVAKLGISFSAPTTNTKVN